MTKLEFEKLLNELKTCNSDYYIDLYYKGINFGAIWYENDFEKLTIEERNNYILLYDKSIRVFVDDAELTSI